MPLRPPLPYQMWELAAGKPAFAGLHYGEVFEAVVLLSQRPPLPPSAPEPFSRLLEQCWAPAPAQRPGFADVLRCLRSILAELEAGAAGAGADPGAAAEASAVPGACAGASMSNSGGSRSGGSSIASCASASGRGDGGAPRRAPSLLASSVYLRDL